ncbi:MAG: VanZ family protein [Euryarchaeota archaeon]|nr:VanZ family protein [Euryarchaeota archaeon]
MKRSIEIAGVIIYSIFLFCLSATPGSDVPKTVMSLSLVFHFMLYFLYGLILFAFFKNPYKAYLAGAFFAASDEIHQYFVPGRTCDPVDFLTDVSALATAIVFAYLWKPLFTFLTSSSREL